MLSHKQLIKEQDEHLDEINQIAVRLHDAAKNIDSEVGKQEQYFEALKLNSIYY